jgi:ligand-binding sensor domain-containing protein
MKNLKTVALLVLLLISSVSANADKYYFEQISLHEGLSQSTVKAIFRDHIGMLWIGTREGLNRYDGQSIRTYLNDPKNPNSLPHNNIFFIAEDSQNRRTHSVALRPAIGQFYSRKNKWSRHFAEKYFCK